MDLETITQSEIHQKEKDKYCILTYVYGSYKDGTDEPICRTALETQTSSMDLGAWCGKERLGEIERKAWKHVHCHR